MKHFCDYKISVIVPVYRVENYLHRCLDSIIRQTYTNLEIILIDDGSDDNCPVICDSFALMDSRLKVIHQANKGLAAARNIGLEAATGDFIAFVDPDDYINVHMYEHMMSTQIENKADIVMCDFEYVYDNEASDKVNSDFFDPKYEFFGGHSAQYLMCMSYDSRVAYTVVWNKLYKKELFEGITYPEGRIHEDEARTHELLYKATSIVYIKSPLYYYYQRNDGIVGSRLSMKNLQLIDAFTDRLSFYREKDEYDLWEMEAIHAMRTFSRLQKELEDADIEADFENQAQFKKLTAELGKYSEIKKLPFKVATEIRMFSVYYRMYYSLYKKKRSLING